MQQNTLVQAKHAAKVGTGSSFFDFLQQLLPFLLNLVHLQKIFFDLFSALAVKFTDPRDFLLELFIFPLLEQVYRVFFDEVRKRNSQTMGMFNFRFIDTDTWAQTTLIESDGNLKARFTDYGRGGKMQGKYEEI